MLFPKPLLQELAGCQSDIPIALEHDGITYEFILRENKEFNRTRYHAFFRMVFEYHDRFYSSLYSIELGQDETPFLDAPDLIHVRECQKREVLITEYYFPEDKTHDIVSLTTR